MQTTTAPLPPVPQQAPRPGGRPKRRTGAIVAGVAALAVAVAAVGVAITVRADSSAMKIDHAETRPPATDAPRHDSQPDDFVPADGDFDDLAPADEDLGRSPVENTEDVYYGNTLAPVFEGNHLEYTLESDFPGAGDTKTVGYEMRNVTPTGDGGATYDMVLFEDGTELPYRLAYAVDAEGRTSLLSEAEAGADLVVSGPLGDMLIPPTPEQVRNGETVATTGEAEIMGQPVLYTVIARPEGRESVTVDAGTFEAEKVVFEVTTDAAGQAGSMVATVWFAENVGAVKMHNSFGGTDITATGELVRHTSCPAAANAGFECEAAR